MGGPAGRDSGLPVGRSFTGVAARVVRVAGGPQSAGAASRSQRSRHPGRHATTVPRSPQSRGGAGSCRSRARAGAGVLQQRPCRCCRRNPPPATHGRVQSAAACSLQQEPARASNALAESPDSRTQAGPCEMNYSGRAQRPSGREAQVRPASHHQHPRAQTDLLNTRMMMPRSDTASLRHLPRQ